MEEYILEECPICRGAGLLMHEGGWNVQVECADCSAHTVYVEYEDEDEKADRAQRPVPEARVVIRPQPVADDAFEVLHVVLQCSGHVMHTSHQRLVDTARSSDNQNFFDSKLINADQKTSDNTAVGVGDYSSSVFDNLYISVFKTESRRKQKRKARIHTTENGDFFIGEFGSTIMLIFFILHEGFVEFQNIADNAHTRFLLCDPLQDERF